MEGRGRRQRDEEGRGGARMDEERRGGTKRDEERREGTSRDEERRGGTRRDEDARKGTRKGRGGTRMRGTRMQHAKIFGCNTQTAVLCTCGIRATEIIHDDAEHVQSSGQADHADIVRDRHIAYRRATELGK